MFIACGAVASHACMHFNKVVNGEIIIMSEHAIKNKDIVHMSSFDGSTIQVVDIRN